MPLAQHYRMHPIRMALSQKYHVMKAVVLRDLRTRFFDHGLGFLIVPLWPLVHMLVLLALYHASGRTAPYGESLNVFFATGLVPTLLFMYVSRFMAYSVAMNRPMMNFPIVTVLDIVFARAYLEIIGAFLTLALIFTVLTLAGDSPWPFDLTEAVSAYLATALLALGVGVIMGVAAAAAPVALTAYMLFLLIVYVASGTLFVASSFPEKVGYALSWNPLLQCVEWMRVAYYPTYSDRLLDRGYVIAWGLGTTFTGLVLERSLRMRLMEG